MGSLSERAPGSMVTPPTSTQRPRRMVAEISAMLMNQVPAVISSTAGTAITSIKTGPPAVTMETEAEVDIMTTGTTAAATKMIGGDGTETPRSFQERLC